LGCVAPFFQEGQDGRVQPLLKKELAPCRTKKLSVSEIRLLSASLEGNALSGEDRMPVEHNSKTIWPQIRDSRALVALGSCRSFCRNFAHHRKGVYCIIQHFSILVVPEK
jgi:hypothetical protein